MNNKMDKVTVLRVAKSITETLIQTFMNLQIDFKKSKKIILKPNLCCYLHPSTGATTGVDFIDALIRSIKNKEVTFYIVESDSAGKDIDIAFELLGYRSLEEKYDNVRLINLTKDKKAKKIIGGLYFDDFEYPEIFGGPHFFISVPKLKTFDADYMTCALKNQFGCNPYPNKWEYHNHLPEVIYDLNKMFIPDLILVDGTIAMEGFGHMSGIPKRMDLVIGGKKPAAVDVVAAKVMGIPYKKVSHLKFALKHGGLGSDNIKVIGDSLDVVKEQFILPKKSVLERILRF